MWIWQACRIVECWIWMRVSKAVVQKIVDFSQRCRCLIVNVSVTDRNIGKYINITKTET